MLMTWINCHHVYVDRLKMVASPSKLFDLGDGELGSPLTKSARLATD